MIVNLTARNRHYVTVGLPLIGLLGAFALAYPRWKTLQSDEAALAQTRKDIALQQSKLALLEKQPASAVVARVPATPDEPVEFLRNLNFVARSCGVRIATYSAAPPAAPTSAAPAPTTAPAANGTAAPGAADALPAGTTEATLNLTAEGTYAAMANFFQRLETYPRLINVSQVSMSTAKYPLLTTQFRLSRYTGLPPTPATP
jgi:hypothetical protein